MAVNIKHYKSNAKQHPSAQIKQINALDHLQRKNESQGKRYKIIWT